MRKYLLTPLLFTFLLPVQAEETCMFVSQHEPDLTIEVGTKDTSNTKGYIKYRGSRVFQFSSGIRSGYGGQYFSIDTIPTSSTDKKENVVSGSVITLVGDQSGTGTPKGKRKPGLNKIFLPNFGLNYWYSIGGNAEKINGNFENKANKISSIIRAAEGFWIPSEICKKYVPYGW